MRRTKKKHQIEKSNAVIYCRVSTEEQTENLSLPTQRQRCMEFCVRRGWRVSEVFEDAGKSAKTAQRPAFQRMLQFCMDDKNGVGYIVVNDLSRFSRVSADQIQIQAQLLAHRVFLRSVTEPIDETPIGILMGTIFGAVNQYENNRKAERTVQGMEESVRLGRWPFKAPLGYVNVPVSDEDPNIVPDSKCHKLVTKAFEMASTGLHTKAEILRTLTAHGLRTARGKPVSPQTFQKILTNPIYAGWIVIPDWDIRVQGSFEALVRQDTFDAVQEVLKGRSPSLTSYERNNPDFPLRRFVRCAKCGTPITGSWSKGRRNRYAYYHCRKSTCRAISIKQDALHAAFLDWLRDWRPESPAIAELKKTIRKVWKLRHNDSTQLRSVLTEKLAKVESRKAALVDRWLDGSVDQPLYTSQIERLNQETDQIRADLSGVDVDQLDIEAVLSFAEKIIGNPARLWLDSTLEHRQRLQKTLFPDGISFDGEEFRTDTTPLFFCLLGGVAASNASMASPTGFEPVLPP
jgi:DNA invertase Pin-like site-specific DNA recombinase